MYRKDRSLKMRCIRVGEAFVCCGCAGTSAASSVLGNSIAQQKLLGISWLRLRAVSKRSNTASTCGAVYNGWSIVSSELVDGGQSAEGQVLKLPATICAERVCTNVLSDSTMAQRHAQDTVYAEDGIEGQSNLHMALWRSTRQRENPHEMRIGDQRGREGVMVFLRFLSTREREPLPGFLMAIRDYPTDATT